MRQSLVLDGLKSLVSIKKLGLFAVMLIYSGAATACETITSNYFLIHSLTIPVNSSPSAYRFFLPGHDIKLSVIGSGQETRHYSDPWGRSVAEYLTVNQAEIQNAVTVCVFADRPASVADLSIVEWNTAELSRVERTAITALVSVSAAWASADAEMQQRALRNLEQFSSSELVSSQILSDLMLYQGISAASLFNYSLAKEALTTLMRLQNGFSLLSHIPLWAMGEIYIREGADAKSNQLLNDAYDALIVAESDFEQSFSLEKAGILSDLGESEIALGLLDQGQDSLNHALELAGTDAALLSHIHNNLAFLYLMQSRRPNIDQDTQKELQKAVTEQHYLARLFAIEAGDNEAQLKAENNQAVHFMRMGETRKALTHYLNALQLINDDQYLELKRAITEHIGSTYLTLGDYQKAESYLGQSIVIAQENRSPQIASATCALGTTFQLQGNTNKAIVAHSRCALYALSQSNGALLIEAFRELSADYQELGKHELSILAALTGERINSTKIENNSSQFGWQIPAELQVNAINSTFDSPLEELIFTVADSITGFDKSASEKNTSDILIGLIAAALEDNSELEESDVRQLRDQTELLVRESPRAGAVLLSRLAMPSADGQHLRFQNQFSKNTYLELIAEARHSQFTADFLEGDILKLYTQLAFSISSRYPGLAAPIIKDTLLANFSAGSPVELVDSLRVAIQIALLNDEPNLVRQYAYAAINQIEQLHSQLEAERLGPTWSNKTHEIFASLVGVLLDEYLATKEQGVLEEAFEISERSRAISLRQTLDTPLSSGEGSFETESQLRAIANLASLRADNALATAREDDESLRSLLLEYSQKHDLISLSRLSNLSEIPVPAVVELSQIAAESSHERLYLNYISTSEDIYLLVLSDSSQELVHLGNRKEITNLATELQLRYREQGSFPIQESLNLSKLLIPDLSAYQQATELVIVPDSGLHTVSFASLSAVQDSYAPLISQFAIRTIPSISTFLMQKSRTGISDDSIAILADPEFSVAPIVNLSELSPPPSRLRSWVNSRERLPYTALEARNLQEQFKDIEVHAFTGKEATRSALGSAVARNSKILHLATHGFFSAVSEDLVGLALSPELREEELDSGFITLTELFSHRFNNQLVVISGCDTSLGEENQGSGLNSLTRGFLAQGVKNVISTLWPVDDRASAEFMREFYANLEQEGDVLIALQATQQFMLGTPDYRNPHFWAGYVLTSVSDDSEVVF